MNPTLVELVPGRVQPALRRCWHLATFRGNRRVAGARLIWHALRRQSLSRRLQRKMLMDRRALLTTMADKLGAREFIAAHVGPGHLPSLLDSAPTVDAIAWEALPRNYVVKVNHGSGGVIIVTEDADPDVRLPVPSPRVGWVKLQVRPEHADVKVISELCRHWLTLDYSWEPGRRSIEWCYEGIPRRVMVEQLLRDDLGCAPREYRLFVIGGHVRFLQVEFREAGVDYTAVMSPDWRLLPVRFLNPSPARAPERPRGLAEMFGIAEALTGPVGDFLRVDLYDLGSRIVVGELTNYPYGGFLPVRPRSFDRECAKYWPR